VATNERSFKWAIVNHVRATCNADGAVLLDIHKGVCYSLNAVGGRIWQALLVGDGKSSIEDIVAALAKEFTEVPRDQLELDIESCLRDLENKALIKPDGRASPTKT
jgi:hypothetical protein